MPSQAAECEKTEMTVALVWYSRASRYPVDDLLELAALEYSVHKQGV